MTAFERRVAKLRARVLAAKQQPKPEVEEVIEEEEVETEQEETDQEQEIKAKLNDLIKIKNTKPGQRKFKARK